MTKSRLCAGIQYSNNQIHIALIEKNNNEFQVKECLTVHDVTKGLFAVKEQLSIIQKELIQPLNIVFALPSADVMTAEFFVPNKFKQKEIKAHIELYAKEKFMRPFSELAYDYSVIKKEEQHQMIRVYAMSKQILEDYLLLGSELKARLVCVEPELHALWRYAKHVIKSDEMFALFEVAEYCLRVVVGYQQKLLFSHCEPLLLSSGGDAKEQLLTLYKEIKSQHLLPSRVDAFVLQSSVVSNDIKGLISQVFPFGEPSVLDATQSSIAIGAAMRLLSGER